MLRDLGFYTLLIISNVCEKVTHARSGNGKKNGRRYDEHTLVYELYLEDGKLRTRNNQAQAFFTEKLKSKPYFHQNPGMKWHYTRL